jgi:DUF1365 family protein
MHSCIYNGWVRHCRYAPTRHEFRYRLFMMYLDLEELPTLFDRFWCWSAARPALARFNRDDYHGPASLPLDRAVRDTVRERTGRAPDGPIRMLTHLRYFGYIFNPVTFYYCFDKTDACVETIVAEITNTPWKQRHSYVLPVTEALQGERVMQFGFDKSFHVSPFMPMDVRYDWRFSTPGNSLLVHMKNFRDNKRTFDATLSLAREEIAPVSMAKTLLHFPAMTAKVTSAIYWQALRLALKRTPFLAHPDGQAVSQPIPGQTMSKRP